MSLALFQTKRCQKLKRKIIGVLCFVMATTLLLASCGKKDYSAITNNPNSVKPTITKALRQRKVVLILIDHTCPDCKRDEDQIVQNVQKLRKNNHYVLVYDISKVSHSDLKYLMRNVPGVEYKNGIATPTFILLRSSEEHHFFVPISVLRDKGTSEQINNFFERAGEH